MTHSPLTDGIQLTPDSSSRDCRRVRKFIVHHAATSSLAGILALFEPGGRTVSANYALGNDGTLICTVDEDRRAWTSSSPQDDGEAVTIEVANARSGEPWPVSGPSFDKLARLIADVSERHDFDINDATVLTHQELWSKFRRSYPTACPGDMQRRKAELIALARYYRFEAPRASESVAAVELPPENEDEMNTFNVEDEGIWVGIPGVGVVHVRDTAHLDVVERYIAGVTGDKRETFNAVQRDWLNLYLQGTTP